MEMQEESKVKANAAARQWCKEAIKLEYRWCVDSNSWYTRAQSGVWERDRLNMVKGEIIKGAAKANPNDTGSWARYFASAVLAPLAVAAFVVMGTFWPGARCSQLGIFGDDSEGA